jgi:uncharacterized protein DUF5060
MLRISVCLFALLFCYDICLAQRSIQIQSAQSQVKKFEKLEFTIRLDEQYDNPYDPQQVDLQLILKTPSGKQLSTPAFFLQDFEWQKTGQRRGRANWYYPQDVGHWRARFAPTETGRYEVQARLQDKKGTVESPIVRFTCTPSQRKGFIRTSSKDPRFMEYDDGSFFFAIGQNVAFIGEGQNVNLTKAEEIFAKLAQNGANYVRIWTCCHDWALALEAEKSAWRRSWAREKNIVPLLGSEDQPNPQKAAKIEGANNKSKPVSPTHNVALRPNTRYVVRGKFLAQGVNGLLIKLGNHSWPSPAQTNSKTKWNTFQHEFTSGANEKWLSRMTLNLMGSGTVWLGEISLKENGVGPELLWEADVNRPKRGVYNQLDSFILDKLVEAAEKNDIYLMLCVITRDLYMNSLKKVGTPEYEKATLDAKNFLRYVVARWGYSTHVGAWEYFNEMNPGAPTDPFYNELGAYLEQIDIYKHLRTTSTWSPSARDCRHPRIDIGQVHHYLRVGSKENYQDEVAMIIEKSNFLREHAPKKPVLIGEFGLATEKWGRHEYMKTDTDGIHFHNALWSSAFAGNSGTAMFWWWELLEQMDMYHHYKPLAAYLHDVSFSNLESIRAKPSREDITILGYQGMDRAYVWLFHSQATWWNQVAQKQTPENLTSASLDITGLQSGLYRIQWWDAWQGKGLKEESLSNRQGTLKLNVPTFNRDLAVKIIQEGN